MSEMSENIYDNDEVTHLEKPLVENIRLFNDGQFSYLYVKRPGFKHILNGHVKTGQTKGGEKTDSDDRLFKHIIDGVLHGIRIYVVERYFEFDNDCDGCFQMIQIKTVCGKSLMFFEYDRSGDFLPMIKCFLNDQDENMRKIEMLENKLYDVENELEHAKNYHKLGF